MSYCPDCAKLLTENRELRARLAEKERWVEELKRTLACFESGKIELGDLSFREQLRSQLIIVTLKENDELKSQLAAQQKPVNASELKATAYLSNRVGLRFDAIIASRAQASQKEDSQ